MNVDLTNPIFHDEAQAREHLEAARWPDGPYCQHCGSFNAHRLEGEKHREGLLYCRDCRQQFSVTVGTVFERSHVPLHKWILANYLMNASKKGVSAHQLHRTIDVTYKTAWFMCHRIREAMDQTSSVAPLGGEGKVVEADEMYIGRSEMQAPSPSRRGAPYLKRTMKTQKRPVVGLVERGGAARAFHVPERVTGKNLREKVMPHASRKSRLHTDESPLYEAIGREFAAHETVHHTVGEYAREDVTTNSVEGFFGILRRGMVGVYQHCGEQHLQRYLNEFAFRYSYRMKSGYSDTERAVVALKGIAGKRLTYRRINTA